MARSIFGSILNVEKMIEVSQQQNKELEEEAKKIADNSSNSGEVVTKKTDVKKSKTKRNISKLTPDFRTKILDFAIEKNYKCADALAILNFSGCRPAELEKGVGVSFNKEKNEIEIKIAGSKLSEKMKRGIRIRKIHIKITNENEQYLKSLILKCEENNNSFIVRIESKKAFSGYITKISKKIWPKKQYHASAYSFRHAKATEMKNAEYSQEDIAKVMGHASCRSQEAYGRKSRKKGTGKFDDIANVEASSQPRPSDRFQRFKIASKNKKRLKM